DVVTAGLDTVAVRVPAHPVAHALLVAAALPIAAPSANRFTQLSPTTAAHVERALGEGVDLILDGGPTSVGIESTVLDLSGARPVLLRPGSIALEELERIVGPLERPMAAGAAEAPRPSPGMLDRHYAPRAELRVFDQASRNEAIERAQRAAAEGRTVGALLLAPLDAPIAHPVAMPHDPTGYAAALYATLHELDALGCDLVLVEAVPAGGAWAGVRDRLQRAAHAE
ncbi:MAG TPA: Sua5 family C-terminal domain-containing protein, partial [Longimicrobiaceae bacterium]|nr:Sua5 family C-terminal domain-containing protein [Longimicrobiaceae bacterium]